MKFNEKLYCNGQKDGNKDGWDMKKGFEKNGPHLSCDLHKIESNLYSELPVTPFLFKNVWSWMDGWMGGWIDDGTGLRIAYSNQKQLI